MFGRTPSRLLVTLAIAASMAAVQAPVVIRMGTVAPRTSPWVDALQSMGQAWATSTAQRVRFTAFADRPSESEVIDKMGTGGFAAGALSVVGLADIDEAFNVLAIPFFFESDEELIHVLDRLTPVLAERLKARHYQLLLWGHGGWVQVFSKQPIRTIADLQKAKLFTSEGNAKVVQWYTANGFHPVPRPAGDIAVQLKLPTGAIDATPGVPPLALATQFYRDAPYMLNVRVAPLVAGVIMTDATWNRIPPDDRTRMLEIAKKTQDGLFADAPGLDARHIKEMEANGLKVIALSPTETAAFRTKADEMTASQRGSMIPEAIYDMAVRERDAFRKSKPRR